MARLFALICLLCLDSPTALLTWPQETLQPTQRTPVRQFHCQSFGFAVRCPPQTPGSNSGDTCERIFPPLDRKGSKYHRIDGRIAKPGLVARTPQG